MLIEDAIRSRRSIRGFDTSYVMSREEKDDLLQQALLAPTSFNLQHVRLVEVSDPQLRAQIRAAGWDQVQMTEASMLVIVWAQVDSWDGAPVEVKNYMVGAIDGYYRGKPQTQRDEAMRSCGLVAQTLMLAARGRGLDSVPMVGFDFDAVGKLINLPASHAIGLMIAVGKQAVEAKPRIGRLPLAETIIRDRF
mgnify:CR=1 FL=1